MGLWWMNGWLAGWLAGCGRGGRSQPRPSTELGSSEAPRAATTGGLVGTAVTDPGPGNRRVDFGWLAVLVSIGRRRQQQQLEAGSGRAVARLSTAE
ncbi:hypothetical protein BD289DRAFT_236943 [Coniella lustricola]|uniref:Secreted protein n=1 Tax=Coniella lustricola TaxID=2025994 RepID=A0A2T3A9S1_9PEZI|nr:hypothetical protein BD289DRAFT_236943 [Coniella lustricola]